MVVWGACSPHAVGGNNLDGQSVEAAVPAATSEVMQATRPFGYAANQLQAFCGEREVGVMRISATHYTPSTPNAQRPTPMSQWKHSDLKC